MLKRFTVWLAVGCVVGCSAGKSTDPGKNADPGKSADPPQKTVFDPLTQQLDRARDVQKTVDQNTDATRKAVESQEHGDDPP